MQENAYIVSAAAYLKRAKGQLEKNDPACIFYAAFELRCFVEARYDEYLDAQKEYARSIPKPHKIGARGRVLDRIFSSSRIQYLSWHVDGELIFEACHVPVTPKLKKEAEWLGNLLHAQIKWRAPKDTWWATTRQRLIGIYRLAWLCEQGRLPCPLFMKDGKILGAMKLMGDSAELERLSGLVAKGDRGILNVDYLSEPPPSWVCDL